ncbi:MAG: NADH-quinone oxidoreductase subunit NuoG [Pseudomonadota bacterium]|nr:NADH-quinone oxidoreductase subunit NuoG [Pseudomonadota bacterium]
MSQLKEKITLYIDDHRIECDPGTTIIEAADKVGIYIPRFCYHEKLSVVANCRMCLVEVEKAPKTLPACATPVANDMRVYTRSKKARQSQKAVMEFLLINHPLDCPICDQGGECELQDIAMGYGEGVSRFTKEKRVVYDENLGPLVATDMTRCIHCTRCVRFGTEIAGIEELGALERGNHMNIGTYLKKGLKSELSGNVIDICPVGALTSKPYRFHGRSWGFSQHSSISPHDCVGSNTYIHSINNGNHLDIMRVVPRKNDLVNETWISDRDRFAYEGIQHKSRINHPMVKKNGQWQEVSWDHVISYIADCFRQVVETKGPNHIAALAHPSSTCEEFYLLQKFMRQLGSNNLDFRLKESDFTDQASMNYAQHFNGSFEDIENSDFISLIGANTRVDQPMLNHRIRKAVISGAKCIRMDSHLDKMNFKTSNDLLVPHQDWLSNIAQLLHAVLVIKKQPIPKLLDAYQPNDAIKKVAKLMCKHSSGLIFVGKSIMHHPHASKLRKLIRSLATEINHTVCFIPEGANSIGAAKMGMLPHLGDKVGMDKNDILRKPMSLYWLHQFEPQHDMDGYKTFKKKLEQSFVIACNHYDSDELRAYADVIIPTCTFAEMSGTFINMLGKHQRFQAALPPLGDSKAGWKIITAIAQTMRLSGFEYPHSQAVVDEFNQVKFDYAYEANALPESIDVANHEQSWIAFDHPFNVDDITRHAEALQAVADLENNNVRINLELAKGYGLKQDGPVTLKFGSKKTDANVIIDEHIADKTIVVGKNIASLLPENCQIELTPKYD